jgi:hypothetical protein
MILIDQQDISENRAKNKSQNKNHQKFKLSSNNKINIPTKNINMINKIIK